MLIVAYTQHSACLLQRSALSVSDLPAKPLGTAQHLIQVWMFSVILQSAVLHKSL
jgi:hypothetical protein